MMSELLLEILSEEIPARMQARAAADLKRLVTDGLKGAGLEFTSAEAYVTPRRLCLVLMGCRKNSLTFPKKSAAPRSMHRNRRSMDLRDRSPKVP